MKRFTIATSMMLVTSPALAVTGITGALVSAYLGFDPGTWIIGAIGGAIAQVKLPPTTKRIALANGVISVMLAGLGAEYVNTLATFEKLPAPSVYLVAFALATLWPWGVDLAKARIEAWRAK